MTRLTNLISSGERAILVDLGAVLYLTSAAFRVLLVATDEAERGAARLALCNVIGHVSVLFLLETEPNCWASFQWRDMS